MYEEYEWLPWKFETTPSNIWKDEKNQRKYLDWLAKELQFKSITDWYRLKQSGFVFLCLVLSISRCNSE